MNIRRYVLFMLVLACLANCVTLQSRTGQAVPRGSVHWTAVEKEILALVNRQRVLRGLAALRPDSRLHRAARVHCREMATHWYLGHDSPDGRDFGERARRQGYRWQRIGENVALLVLKEKPGNLARRVLFGSDHLERLRSFARRQGLPLPRSWSDVGRGWGDGDWDRWRRLNRGRGGWMGSAGHRKNILLSGITDMGVGHWARRDGAGWTHHYFAAEFAVPASPPGRAGR